MPPWNRPSVRVTLSAIFAVLAIAAADARRLTPVSPAGVRSTCELKT